MSEKRKCYCCDKPLAERRPMSGATLELAGQDFGLGDIEIPPETCPHCGETQPAPTA